MKIAKRLFLTVLAALMLMALLGGCTDTRRKEKLAGTYMLVALESEAQIHSLLESIDACDEEIALVNKHSLYSIRLMTFTAGGTYTMSYDVESTKAYVRTFYQKYFDALYEGRTTLNEVYGKTFDEMDQADFRQFYADLYGCKDYSALLDRLVANAYQYETLQDPWQVGTYTTEVGKLFCTPNGEETNKDEYIVYTLEENFLTLTYANNTDVYTRLS